MVYKCMRKNCGFLFSRAGEPEACPDCGGQAIRPADPLEQREHEENLRAKWDDMTEKKKD